ncbi:siderophore-interacting protein [Pengzhenrongella sicca]|uniref:Siderophore-interacting protein n=1 Tax=Pengzhenrongella sicca TaxID=2819238 RepID=A0A8A4ZGW0_9MICO|nr:siderophore-interacting protein [Pengzhenrongella sicca]QTE30631.1 siderophore-interacting protein [Pengzhenrongella sicca]
MSRYPRLMPAHPRLFTAQVVRSERRSPSFQRVTIAGAQIDEFVWAGFDHWFRLFIPPTAGAALVLPDVAGRSWWKPYLAIPEPDRPHCSNYTVADVRQAGGETELDIDVVLHWDAQGRVAGPVAIWSVSAAPGAEVALLDQGLLFDPPGDAGGIRLVADETGLPAVRGILRHLPAAAVGSAILEVPTSGDVEDLAAPAGVHVTWLARDDPRATPGALALAEVGRRAAPGRNDYAFVVGESSLATQGRRLLHRAGLPKARITFSGFWKHSPTASIAR